MNLLKEVAGEVGKKFARTPGLGYVTVVASVALGTLQEEKAQEADASEALLALGIALVAYWCGGLLDDLVFEPFYGLAAEAAADAGWVRRRVREWFIAPTRRFLCARSLAAGLAGARGTAASSFHITRQEGIYKTAKLLLAGTEAWEGLVSLTLDLSKTARTFILPAVVLLIWDIASRAAGVNGLTLLGKHPATAWLLNPWGPLLVLVVLTALYVDLRLRHMRRLYKVLAEIPKRSCRIDVPGSSAVTLWCVGDKVIEQSRLPVFGLSDSGPARPPTTTLVMSGEVGY